MADHRPRTYQSEDTDARLRSRVAQAYIKAGDAGAYEAAIATLVQVAAGRDADGNAVNIRWRTRVGAASALLRGAQTACSSASDVINDNRMVVALGADAVAALARLQGTPEGRAALNEDLAAIMAMPEPARDDGGDKDHA